MEHYTSVEVLIEEVVLGPDSIPSKECKKVVPECRHGNSHWISKKRGEFYCNDCRKAFNANDLMKE